MSHGIEWHKMFSYYQTDGVVTWIYIFLKYYWWKQKFEEVTLSEKFQRPLCKQL